MKITVKQQGITYIKAVNSKIEINVNVNKSE